MIDQVQFLKKINDLKEECRKNPALSREEIASRFEEDGLTAAQMQLVFEVLFPEKEEIDYTEEEKAYLKAYEEDIRNMKAEYPGEREELLNKLKAGKADANTIPRLTELYLPQVIAKAKEYHCEEVTIDELVEEGNISLMLALGESAPEDICEIMVLEAMEDGIAALADGMKKMKSHDRSMVEKVQMLDNAITELTEDLGRKVTIYELCEHLNMTEQEVADIMRLAGEEPEDKE
jgi:DNA-directed RNA polymerase sigma subunit (sigma70/sigma32)